MVSYEDEIIEVGLNSGVYQEELPEQVLDQIPHALHAAIEDFIKELQEMYDQELKIYQLPTCIGDFEERFGYYAIVETTKIQCPRDFMCIQERVMQLTDNIFLRVNVEMRKFNEKELEVSINTYIPKIKND